MTTSSCCPPTVRSPTTSYAARTWRWYGGDDVANKYAGHSKSGVREMSRERIAGPVCPFPPLSSDAFLRYFAVGTGRPAFSTPSRTESQVFQPNRPAALSVHWRTRPLGIMDRLRVMFRTVRESSRCHWGPAMLPAASSCAPSAGSVPVLAMNPDRLVGGSARRGASALSSISSYSS